MYFAELSHLIGNTGTAVFFEYGDLGSYDGSMIFTEGCGGGRNWPKEPKISGGACWVTGVSAGGEPTSTGGGSTWAEVEGSRAEIEDVGAEGGEAWTGTLAE